MTRTLLFVVAARNNYHEDSSSTVLSAMNAMAQQGAQADSPRGFLFTVSMHLKPLPSSHLPLQAAAHLGVLSTRV